MSETPIDTIYPSRYLTPPFPSSPLFFTTGPAVRRAERAAAELDRVAAVLLLQAGLRGR
jgi:hypothetical protein